jgi:D-inositol-3-phosphate glycosyltransferase
VPHGRLGKDNMRSQIKVSLLTGGGDTPYALGMLNTLIAKEIDVEFIGNADMEKREILSNKRVNFLNLRGDQNPSASKAKKVCRVLRYYGKLIKYAGSSDANIFHILWLNKFILFDRTFLNLYYKLLGKKILYTAHNIDEKERDGSNNFLNRLSLKILYRLVDHIFVHTNKMKSQLIGGFSLDENKVTVIPFGINNTIPRSNMARAEARAALQLNRNEKVLLFFGNIAPYKGLEYAIHALERLKNGDDAYRLVVAGQIKGCQPYWEKMEQLIDDLGVRKFIIQEIKYIPDEKVEAYFKASDVLLLPYKFIYQSGVLFLSYSFGLPVIATDVGSLRDDIVEGKTGMICRAGDPDDLAEKIAEYFESDLFHNLEENMKDIRNYGNAKYSWDGIGDTIRNVYMNVLAGENPVR